MRPQAICQQRKDEKCGDLLSPQHRRHAAMDHGQHAQRDSRENQPSLFQPPSARTLSDHILYLLLRPIYIHYNRLMKRGQGERREMVILYNQYHSYVRVAREIGRSASCVRYNVMMKNAPKVVRDTFPDTVRK